MTLKKLFLAVTCMLGLLQVARSADLIEVKPLTDRWIMLHISDGHIDYHGYHQTGPDDRVVSDPLDVKAAVLPVSYQLSVLDGKKSSTLSIVKTGRKTKANGAACDCRYDEKTQLCNSPWVLEHWIYLQVAKPLERGKTYRISTKGLVKNGSDFSFVYSDLENLSPIIHVNQLGFVPQARQKFGYLSHWMGDAGALDLQSLNGKPFHLVRVVDQQVVFSGTISKQKDRATGAPECKPEDSYQANLIGADVWQCDFSTFTTPGEYLLVVEGVGKSYPFELDNDIYRKVFYTTTRGLYHHRSGIELKQPYTRFWRGVPHNPNITPGFRLRYSTYRYMDSPDENAPLDELEAQIDDNVNCNAMWGWYQDAGDWDAYTSHAVIPAFLLTAFELAVTNFKDGELNIPESGNGIPDMLDEAGWLIHHYSRTKGPTGGNAGGRIEGDRYPNKEAGKGIPSYEDIRSFWIVYGEEPLLTYKYARLAAHYAYCFQLAFDNGTISPKVNVPDSVAFWTREAENAYQWAGNNLRSGDEPKIKADRASAAAWLFKLTRQVAYQQQFEKDIAGVVSGNDKFESYKWGIWGYVTTARYTTGLNIELQKQLVEFTRKHAEKEVTDAIEKNNRSFRLGTAIERPVLQGHATTPLVMPAIVAYEVTGDKKFIDAVYTSCDYMLGGNPLNTVWITGLGDNPVQQAFHMDSWYSKQGIKEIVPGIIPYGPQYSCDWMPGKDGNCDAGGWWDSDYLKKSCYPNQQLWPAHEMWFNHRYAPPVAEYTVHQNIGPAAAVYGYLTAPLK